MEKGERREKQKYHVDPLLRRGFYLNEVVVLPNDGLVICHGEQHHLPPKAMELLLFMVQNRNRMLSVQKLLVFGWGDINAKRANLTHVISEIRQALDDQKACPEFIQTIKSKGYRLIAKVLPIDEKVHYSHAWPLKKPTHSSLLNNSTLKTTSSNNLKTENHWHLSLALFKNSRLFSVTIAFVVSTWVIIQIFEVLFPIFGIPGWGLKIAVLVLVIGFPLALLYTWLKEIKIKKIILAKEQEDPRRKFFFKQLAVDFSFIGLISIGVGFLALYLIESIETDANSVQVNSSQPAIAIPMQDNLVAVIPFEFNSDQQLPNYFKSTLHSELLLALANQNYFKLVSHRAVSEMAIDSTLSEYAQKLGARYLLDGKVFAQEKGFSIVLSLTDTQNSIQVWGSSVEGNSAELLQVHKELYRQVFNAFSLLAQQPSKDYNVISTNDFSAYDSYIQGKDHLANASHESELELAEFKFLNALKFDSKFSLATAGLCQTYLDLYELRGLMSSFLAAKEQCSTLLKVGQLKAGGFNALGNLNRIGGENEKAIELYQQAIALSADNIDAITGMAKSNQQLGLYEEAENLFRQVILIEPGYWKNYSNLGDFLFSIGSYLSASEQYAKVTMLRPKDAQAFNRLGAAFYLDFKMEEATVAWSKSLTIEPLAANYSNLGTALFFSNQFELAAENYLNAVALQPNDPTMWSNLGDAQKFAKQSTDSINSFKKSLMLADEKLTVNPNDLELNGLRARVLSELGECENALNLVNQLAANNTTEPYFYYDLSLASLRCKKIESAKQFIQKAVILGYPEEVLKMDIQFSSIIAQISLKLKN